MNQEGLSYLAIRQTQATGLNQLTQIALESPKGPIEPENQEQRSYMLAAVGQSMKEKMVRGIRTREISVKDPSPEITRKWEQAFLDTYNEWIDTLIDEHRHKRASCIGLSSMAAYFPTELLMNSYYVIVDDIPRPQTKALAGFGQLFAHPDLDGISYKDTFFIRRKALHNLSNHFHELVHICQWKALGDMGFLKRYIGEVQACGYRNAPMEKMAYDLQARYCKGEAIPNVQEVVVKALAESETASP
ncbi:hypothetical protein [Endozoicomonas arenosclerae]|uniref:hypothetical protein n=1 Tax=Endozoicomonas arenosclerae TaxID=1633495 RepID=UPI0007854612|nr:hypothetical protein [Endozoicomonas arenosclerae]